MLSHFTPMIKYLVTSSCHAEKKECSAIFRKYCRTQRCRAFRQNLAWLVYQILTFQRNSDTQCTTEKLTYRELNFLAVRECATQLFGLFLRRVFAGGGDAHAVFKRLLAPVVVVLFREFLALPGVLHDEVLWLLLSRVIRSSRMGSL